MAKKTIRVNSVLKTVTILAILSAVTDILYAQRTDVIVFDKGNRVIGEVKTLSYGSLVYKTDDAGDLNVDWYHVVKIKSNSTFSITLRDFRRFEGSIDSTETKGVAVIESYGQRIFVQVKDIVLITQLYKKFWARMDGYIKLGFSYTKASEIAQINTSAKVTYRTYTDEVVLSGTVNISRQDVADSIIKNRNQSVRLDYRRFLLRRWFILVTSGIEQNTELGIDYRVTGGGGVGKSIFENHVHMLRLSVGTVYTREETNEHDGLNNMEGLAAIGYKVFKKTIPKVVINTTVVAYPSFNNPGRVRLDGDASLDFEIIDDFTIGISNYHNYDSRPSSSTASSYDWGVVFNLGYSF